jgi:hypothetical protein
MNMAYRWAAKEQGIQVKRKREKGIREKEEGTRKK